MPFSHSFGLGYGDEVCPEFRGRTVVEHRSSTVHSLPETRPRRTVGDLLARIQHSEKINHSDKDEAGQSKIEITGPCACH